MLLRQFRLGNNLPMHIRENTDFPEQEPRQLLVNFEGCNDIRYLGVLFFECLKYFRQVWRCPHVIAHLILQRLYTKRWYKNINAS